VEFCRNAEFFPTLSSEACKGFHSKLKYVVNNHILFSPAAKQERENYSELGKILPKCRIFPKAEFPLFFDGNSLKDSHQELRGANFENFWHKAGYNA